VFDTIVETTGMNLV